MGYLAASIIIFIAIFVIEGFVPYYDHGSRLKRMRHGVQNLLVAATGGIIVWLLVRTEAMSVITWAATNDFGLVNILPGPWYVKAVVAFLLFDLWMYAWHYSMHMIKPFWKLHAAHHTDTTMDVTTAVRFHPLELVVAGVFKLAVLPIIGMQLGYLMLYELLFKSIVFLHHSNIGLPERIDRILRTVILTPNLHRVHHSRIKSETNSNYGSIFSFWDRLFGTYRTKENTLDITIGLETMREKRWQGIRGILLTPFFIRS